MALGDKRPVVMGAEKAVPGGVATLDADGKLTAEQRPGLAEIQGGSNPNLLINWDFRNPVNRNGNTEYSSTSAVYFIDRWKFHLHGGSYNVAARTIHMNSNNHSGIMQYYEYYKDLIGKTVTLSFLYSSDVTTRIRIAGELNHNGVNIAHKDIPAHEDPEVHSVTATIPNNIDAIVVQIFNTANAAGWEGNIVLDAAKLELGAHQTLAWQNEEGAWELIDPPDYALQYALCSQYSPITGEFVGSQQSNENLLDNWYFPDPINQNGRMEYESGVYTIDRWRAIRCAATLTNSGLICTNTSTGDAYIYQLIDGFDLLYGKAVTLSALIDGMLLSVTAVVAENINYGTNIINGVQIRIRANKQLSVWFIDDQPHTVEAVKFELGPVQTLAHKKGNTWVLNDPPPNKALELTKCQRYQSVLTANGNNITIATGRCLSDGNITVALPIGPLRIIPANIANPTGLIAATDIFSGTTVPITAVTFIGYRPGEKMITALFKCPAGTVGTIYRVGLLSGNSLVFDANL